MPAICNSHQTGCSGGRDEDLRFAGRNSRANGSFPTTLILGEIKAVFHRGFAGWDAIVFALVYAEHIARLHEEVIVSFLGPAVIEGCLTACASRGLDGVVGSHFGLRAAGEGCDQYEKDDNSHDSLKFAEQCSK
jgi:hypothetical protein